MNKRHVTIALASVAALMAAGGAHAASTAPDLDTFTSPPTAQPLPDVTMTDRMAPVPRVKSQRMSRVRGAFAYGVQAIAPKEILTLPRTVWNMTAHQQPYEEAMLDALLRQQEDTGNFSRKHPRTAAAMNVTTHALGVTNPIGAIVAVRSRHEIMADIDVALHGEKPVVVIQNIDEITAKTPEPAAPTPSPATRVPAPMDKYAL